MHTSEHLNTPTITKMRLTPQSIRRVADGLVIEGPQGSVLIRRQIDRIETQYQGDQLVNGNAAAYSKALFEQAIELTNRIPFPWHIEADGTQRITDHQRYYEQTFNSDLQGIEMLKRWIHRSSFLEIER
jgi:hypothetical protein